MVVCLWHWYCIVLLIHEFSMINLTWFCLWTKDFIFLESTLYDSSYVLTKLIFFTWFVQVHVSTIVALKRADVVICWPKDSNHVLLLVNGTYQWWWWGINLAPDSQTANLFLFLTRSKSHWFAFTFCSGLSLTGLHLLSSVVSLAFKHKYCTYYVWILSLAWYVRQK